MLGVTVLLLVMVGLAQAGTITVGPGVGFNFETIQAGIDAATAGDTVLVAPGEYVITEPITFGGKAITVRSEAGRDETTIRMGTPTDTNRGSVIIFENGETTASVLDGFTITGGISSWVPSANAYAGGGIYFNASSGSLIHCAVVKNRADNGGGGGVSASYGSSPILTNCIFTGNSATLAGGGVLCYINSSMTMTDCIIRGNSSLSLGGGVYVGSNSSIAMTNCTIISNTAQDAGAGIACSSSSATLTHCIIARNTGAKWGGGLGIEYEVSTTINNSTIWGNSAGEGGGMGCLNGASATVANSVFWANTAHRGTEIFLEESPTRFSVSYSNVAGGQAGVCVQGASTLDWGPGDIDADPLFADPHNGDFHLKSEVGRWDPNNQTWIQDDVTSPCIDAGDPNSPIGYEPEPNGGIVNMGAYGGTIEASMSPGSAEEIVYIQWLGHSTVKVWTEDSIVYVDPERVPEALHDATLVCVTHTHGDHYSPSDITKVSNAQTQFVGPPDVVQRYGSGQTIAPGQAIEFDFVNVIAVPAYNTNKPNHPKSNNWVGFILELGGRRIYVAGDTDLIEEMKSLGEIDVAFLPAGGTYTMNAVEAAEATQYIKPRLAIPYHWGQSVGTLADAQRFAELARCAVKILAVGETIGSDEWPEYQPLIAHWALDETEGDVAYDSAGDHDGVLFGDPAWQPDKGKIDGALEFDGVNDYVSMPFVVDPGEGVFSAFAWVKGGVAGQAILSQTDNTGEMWMGVDSLQGNLVSGLVPPPAGRTVTPPLESPFLITDGQWHHVGFVWDGQRRHLYADGVEVVGDASAINPLTSSDGGMHLGAGKSLEASCFWFGLIDDVRIYNQALDNEEVEALLY